MSVSVDESVESFLAQAVVGQPEAGEVPPTPMKLVSLDVDVDMLHAALRRVIAEHDDLGRFRLRVEDSGQSTLQGKQSSNKRLVLTTHVTLVHRSSTSQADMRTMYGALIGAKVPLKAIALYWSDKVAALEVEVSACSTSGLPVPPSTNTFVHITIWKLEETKSFESNNLPDLVASGSAEVVRFQQPIDLESTLSFWEAK